MNMDHVGEMFRIYDCPERNAYIASADLYCDIVFLLWNTGQNFIKQCSNITFRIWFYEIMHGADLKAL